VFHSSLRATLVFALAFVTFASVANAAARPPQDSAQVKDQAQHARPLFAAPAAGDIKTIAGTGSAGVTGDGQQAIDAEIFSPQFEVFDASGNLYFADTPPCVVRMVNATTGVITTVAGTAWSSGDSGDNGPATSATLNYPVGLAFDSHGNLYISENGGNRIRMVATGTGTITTVAGTGTGGFSGDSGVPTAAELNGPGGLAFDHNGNLYVADGANNRIREITPNAGVIATGTITTVAGGNNGAYNGDGIAATTAYLNYPYGVAVDASGNIYIADTENHRIRKITKSTGLISTIAGTGTTGDSASTATSTTLATSVEIGYPNQVALDSSGNVYFADNGNNRVDEVAVTTGYFSVVAGNGQSGFNGNGPAIGAELNSQAGVVVDGNLNVFIADSGNSLIREVAPGASTQTATPYFSVAPGPVNSGQTVEILDATPSAVIYYTTDGSTPTTSSPVYSAPIAINKVMTINAIAQASGLTVSLPASGAYTIILPVAATPVFSPPGGNFTSVQNVTITDSSPGATIYYTTDGSYPSTSSPVYTAPVHIATPTLLYAIAGGAAYQNSSLADAQYELYLTPPVAPTFTPPAGAYTGTQNVNINAPTPGSITYYTIDGTTPTTSSPQVASLIPVSSNLTIKAFCAISGWPNSPVASASYTIVPLPAPTFSLTSGAYNGVQTVYLSDTNSSAQIYYTTDGSAPTSASNEFFSSQGIRVSSNETINAIAYLNSSVFSTVTSATYTINNGAPTPTFSPAPGTYTSAQSVRINGTPGVPTYYTTDGSTPTTSSTMGTGPITVSSTETIKAIASGDGYTASNVAIGLYIINQPAAATPTFSPAPGNYTSMPTVTMSSTTPGANIYYTTNGTTPTTASQGYNGPIVVRSATTFNAIAGESGYASSPVATAAYTLTAGAPTFSPAAGNYTSAQTVTINSVTPGATIYYTTNGSTPTSSSPVYGGPISVSSSETIKAFAAETGFTSSAVTSAAYTINLAAAATPTFSPVAGTYTSPQSVTLSSTTPGSKIYYTTNGTTPTTSSTLYSSPISVSASETIEAIATASGFTTSAVGSAAYTINLPATATPTFSPAAGTYNTGQIVTISDATSGALIYYTTDGTTPTTSSTRYVDGVGVYASQTLKAIAVDPPNYANSAVASATYTLTAATPVISPAAGAYTKWQTVTITDATPTATIYYTTDGSTPTSSSNRYLSSFVVSTSETVKAIAISSGYTNSAVASAAYTLNLPQAATPTISPAGGVIYGPKIVTISDTTPGATIYYTTDGSTPTTASSQYGGPFDASSTETIKAIAGGTNLAPSPVASASFTLTAATPTFSPAAGTYSTAQTVTISANTVGATIYYTTNGTTPTTSSTKYTAPITVSSTETIQAIAVATGYANSATASAAYTLMVATPVFSPAGGAYSGPGTARISDTTPGATIYYTTNGTTPTASSTKYSGTITVSQTGTIKAIGVETGYSNSVVASAAFTLTVATPTFSRSAGSYVGAQTTTISDTTPGATIYYTTNGTTPTAASTKYTGAITISQTETIKAIGVETGYSNSAVASAAYTIDPFVISTVSAVLPVQTQNITITGSGFGANGTGPDMYFYDNTGGWAAGAQQCPNLCLSVSSWTDKQIVISGITGSGYGVGNAKLKNGDSISLTVSNAQQPGDIYVHCNNIVVGAGATTCTASNASTLPAPLTSAGNQPRSK